MKTIYPDATILPEEVWHMDVSYNTGNKRYLKRADLYKKAVKQLKNAAKCTPRKEKPVFKWNEQGAVLANPWKPSFRLVLDWEWMGLDKNEVTKEEYFYIEAKL